MLIKVYLKDAARLRDLNGERFLAFVEGENALLRPAAACRLVESVFGPTKLEISGQRLTEVIEAVSQLISERKWKKRHSESE